MKNKKSDLWQINDLIIKITSNGEDSDDKSVCSNTDSDT